MCGLVVFWRWTAAAAPAGIHAASVARVMTRDPWLVELSDEDDAASVPAYKIVQCCTWRMLLKVLTQRYVVVDAA